MSFSGPLPCLFIFFGYLSGFVLYFIHFEIRKDVFMTWGKRVLITSFIVHGLFLASLFSKNAGPGAAVSVAVISFLILTVAFIAEWRSRARYLILFSLPLVILFCMLGVLAQTGQAERALPGTASGWLWLHLGLVLSGFAGLILSVAAAVMYLVQSTQLKSKHLGRAFASLPSLESLDRIHFRCLSVGIMLFSLGILSGLFWAKDLQSIPAALGDPKVQLSFFTCLLYWGLLALRLGSMRRGQKIAAGTVLVFALLVTTFSVSHVVPFAAAERR